MLQIGDFMAVFTPCGGFGAAQYWFSFAVFSGR
jgi:hypothetical protein